ncbi:hypothetical protein ACFFYR_37585 [Paraburkholderia dipogonis]|uniref:hypothetical protein n=1 Tax=Paraburkholderia dipogonis TaxID=1211383 RepID=UPI00141AC7DC|nr:hypothetical protein [Paraburkholderia dipogonis]
MADKDNVPHLMAMEGGVTSRQHWLADHSSERKALPIVRTTSQRRVTKRYE